MSTTYVIEKLAQMLYQEEYEKAKAMEAGKLAAQPALDIEKEMQLTKAREMGKLMAQPKPKFMEAFKSRGLPIVAAGATLMTLFFAADQIIDYLEKKGKAVKSKEYFQAMLKAHPQLQSKDPKIVAQYWESLYHFNPAMAEDPLASGAWITQATRSLSGLELGGPAPDSYATLTQIAKQMKESKVSNKINASEFILPDISRGLLNLGA